MNIKLDNFIFRSLTATDGLRFFELIQRNRARLLDYFPMTLSVINSPDDCNNYVQERLALVIKKEHFCFFIVNEEGCIQGVFFLKNLDWRIPKGELAYFIDKSLEGKGIMTKALSLLTRHCFETLGMNKLFIITATDNHSSKKIAEKNGFEIEGILRKNYKIASGELIDNIYYGLLRPQQ